MTFGEQYNEDVLPGNAASVSAWLDVRRTSCSWVTAKLFSLFKIQLWKVTTDEHRLELIQNEYEW